MQYLLMALFVAGIAAADQITKLLVVQNIPLHGQVEAIPGLFHLTYVRNTGAAFSMLQGMQWLFLIIFIVITLWIIWEFSKKRLPLTMFERWCIASMYAGGLGNMIDRMRLGYVVDMINLDFMEFPVFNLADCFVTCGCVLLVAHLLLCNREFWKEDRHAADR